MVSHLPHHKFIYGAPITDFVDQIEAKEPFKKYVQPMRPELEGHTFIGFEYGRLYGLFNGLHSGWDELQLANFKVPADIKKLFRETYPGLRAKSYALIQNVYTSHRVVGEIAYGYWILSKTGASLTEENSDKLIDSCLYLDCIYGHNMEDTPSDFLRGERLAEISGAELEDMEALAVLLTRKYRAVELRPREELLKELKKIDSTLTLSRYPSINVLQTMCYCCT